MNCLSRVALACASLFAGRAGFAQSTAPIPIRALVTEARIAKPLGNISGIRHLPDGRVLVNDRYWRRLMVFDKSLATFVITADTAAGAPAPFPMNRSGSLIPYNGDSTLIVDDLAHAFIVIDQAGRPSRTIAVPVATHYSSIASTNPSGLDGLGHLLYQESQTFYIGPSRGTHPSQDSISILRADFERRTFDSVAKIRVQGQPQSTLATDPTGRITGASMKVNPAGAAVDSWTVTSDGTVAIVRGHDYHIDWIATNGARGSTPKMPYDWRRLTDTEKQLKIDSARKFIDIARANGGYTIQSCPVREPLVDAGDAVGGGGGRAGASGGRGTSGDTSAKRNENRCYPVPIATDFVPLSEIPDYIPPVRVNSVTADRDGNVWILPTTTLQAKDGLLYDVVNKKGELFERVQLPADRAIAGFGPGGIVYLSQRDGTNGIYLERARIVRTDR